MAAALGWAGLLPLLSPPLCSISTQLITRSISDCGQQQLFCFRPSPVADALLFLSPVSSAASKNSMNQLPASACICFASFSEEPRAEWAVVVAEGGAEEDDDLFSSPPSSPILSMERHFLLALELRPVLPPPSSCLGSNVPGANDTDLDTPPPPPMPLRRTTALFWAISCRTGGASSGSSSLATAAAIEVAAWIASMSVTACTASWWKLRKLSKQEAGVSGLAVLLSSEKILQCCSATAKGIVRSSFGHQTHPALHCTRAITTRSP
jgi:hypothetical protein